MAEALGVSVSTRLKINAKQAFIVGETELRRVVDIVRRRVHKEISLETELGDGTTRTFESETEFLQFSNPRRRRIQQLTISSRSSERPFSHCEVEFDRRRHLEGVTIGGAAEDDIVVVLRHELTEIVESCRPTYSPIAVRHFGLSLTLSLVTTILLSAYVLGVLFHRYDLSHGRPITVVGLVLTGIVLWWALYFSLAGACGKLIQYVFPMGVFLIGDELVESKRRDRIRSVIGVGIILAFAISVVASVVASHL